MITDFLKSRIQSQATYPEVGFGQVEPNHLSAQYTGQIYAQLPAAADIEILEQGQFVKYDYMNEVVNFTGAGEWMLVYNETKLYRDFQRDCEFAMIKGNYQARVYSPMDGTVAQEMYGPTRFLQGRRERWDNEKQDFVPAPFKIGDQEVNELPVYGKDGKPVAGEVADYSVANKIHDYYEMDDINNPEIAENYRQRLFMKIRDYKERMMPKGTTMVPRVFKTMPGDHYTTNMINEDSLAVGDLLYVGEKGILCKTAVDASETFAGSGDMTWQVVKVYTMPDFQRGVKVMRIK